MSSARSRKDFQTGDHVRLPEGGVVAVLWTTTDGMVAVQLDGEAIGLYPPERLERFTHDQEEER